MGFAEPRSLQDANPAGRTRPPEETRTHLPRICLPAGGRILLCELPGIGETPLAWTFAHTLGIDFQRIQFTSACFMSALPTNEKPSLARKRKPWSSALPSCA